jgi:hypothetical protein
LKKSNWGQTILQKYELKELRIETGRTSINDGEFCNMENLETVTLPDDIKVIGKRAFQGCKKLKSINLPTSLISIGDFAFDGCESLIGKSEGFVYCESRFLTIPDYVERIGSCAFRNCKKLRGITLGAKTRELGESAFAECQSLELVELPDVIHKWERGVFRNCKALEGFAAVNYEFSKNEPEWFDIDSIIRKGNKWAVAECYDDDVAWGTDNTFHISVFEGCDIIVD